MVGEMLSRSQLKRLAEHQYSVTGVSLLEPYLQVFWKWLVLRIPETWAPNAMTLAGLLINIFTSAILMFYSPDGKGEPPSWSYFLCALGLFIYQTLDAIDGKQARRINCSSPLGELFDHGCDALSIVFVIVSTCIAMQIGINPHLMFFECFATMFLFYTAHWQAYCSGLLKFNIIDVTEGQISITSLYILTGIFGSSFWSYELPAVGLQLKMLPILFSFFGALLACYNNFYTIFMKGGVGKNGSTVAGTSVLSPLGPIGLLIGLAVAIWVKSSTNVFHENLVLYIMSFGMAACKVTNKLVIAHMSRTEMDLLDTSLLGPGLLFLNQYFDTYFNEHVLLWICFIFCSADLLYYSTQVCRQMTAYLNIYCFSVERPPPPVPIMSTGRSAAGGPAAVNGVVGSVLSRGAGFNETSMRQRSHVTAAATDSSRSRSSSASSSCDNVDASSPRTIGTRAQTARAHRHAP
jgi:phosphatidylglycerophosphate synthase